VRNAHPITRETAVVRTTNVLHSDMGDEVVMLSLERDAYYGLDPIGAQIWKYLAEPRLVSALCEWLLPQFTVTPEQCEADVLSFLHALYEQDLIEIVGPETPAG